MGSHQRPYRYARQLKERERRLREKAQRLGVLDRLPEVIRSVWGFNARRRKINSIAHGGK